MMDRRAFLLTTAASAAAPRAFAGVPASRRAGSTAGAEKNLDMMLQDFFAEGLQQRPEGATQLGLDKGVYNDLKFRLSDESDAGREAARAMTRRQIDRLQAFPTSTLSLQARLNYDVILYTRQSQAAVQAFDFGGSSYGPSPYVVSQLTGAYQSVPDFLDTKHRIETADDADAYLSRMNAFAGQLDANTERMRHDAGLGVVPPDFLLDVTLEQMTRTRTSAPDATVVTSLARRAASKGLDPRYGRDAGRIWNEKILPALDRQLAQTRTLRAKATHDAGCWKFPRGAAFYETALNNTTTTRLSPDEVHRIGLEQAKEISARMDVLLKAQGMTTGTIAQRVQALYRLPGQVFPNTDAGKAEAIAFCNSRLDAIRPRLPSVFRRVPSYHFEVRRVPPQTEAGAASAFSQAPAVDGSRPGLVYFNLHDTAEWPRFSMVTTVYHEGLPGHQLEGGLALSNDALPLIRKTTNFSGYGEGWALYAEQLADEMGMYDDDPLGRIGYLKAQLFRANRCVVDTGIHAMRWGREQAIAYFVEQEGDAPGFVTREVERYCATPGQACSYKLGHATIVNIRARAKAALGPRFDLKDFHEAILRNGRVPLDILDRLGDAWIASAKAA